MALYAVTSSDCVVADQGAESRMVFESQLNYPFINTKQLVSQPAGQLIYLEVTSGVSIQISQPTTSENKFGELARSKK